MTDTKNNKDILFYVRCLPEHDGLLLNVGQVYGVLEVNESTYKIKMNANFIGWFDKYRFEPIIIKKVQENIEKVLA